jgi:glucarate dehydratase
MRIVDIEAFEVAVPFRSPILSSFGVSYPARVRTFVRVHTDVGLVGLGEAGPSATHPFALGAMPRRFETTVKAAVVGESPADHRWLARKLFHGPEATAIEIACWDLLAQAAGVPLYRLLGGHGEVASVPVAGYAFFRLANRDGDGAVDLDGMVEHCRQLHQDRGFDVVKVKLGAHPPEDELDVVERVRATLGPRVGLRVDPNGSWSLPTALRALRRLEPLDLEYVEEPVRALGTGDATVATDSLRRLRAATTTPIAADHCYRPDLLALVLRAEAADVVLADLFGAGGMAEARHYCRLAASFGLGVALHSGTELGVGQLAKAHLQASLPDEVRFAGDAIYPEYVDDVLVGGPLAIEGGALRMPQSPGLGATLDEQRLERWTLTPERKADLDAYWADLKASIGVGFPSADHLVRHY